MTSDLEKTIETMRAFMEDQIPFNRLVGLRLDSASAGEATLRVPFREELIGDPLRPALHGGVISMLADTAGGAATFTNEPPGTRISTVDLRIDYLRPGEMRDLLARGKVLRSGNRVAVVTIEIFHEEPYVHVADGRAVYNIRRG